MFGGRSSSAAHGQGIAGYPTSASSVPMPSGGFSPPSVHNQSLDLVTNDVPSTLVIPSTNEQLNPEDQPENEFRLNDFVMVLRNTGNYDVPRGRFGEYGARETPIVTIPMLNKLLRDKAIAHESSPSNENPWWEHPCLVAEMAVPFGAVLNQMQLGTLGGGGGSRAKRDRVGTNVVVSRRAYVKNNLLPITGVKGRERWHSQSTQRVALQYSKEQIEIRTNRRVDCVFVSMVILNVDPHQIGSGKKYAQRDPRDPNSRLIFSNATENRVHVDPSAYALFEDRPTSEESVIVPFGRILHSAPTCPTVFDGITSCVSKREYDRLKPIEIELGCQ